MGGAAGESGLADLRVEFDRRLKLEFHGSRVTSDAGLLAFRELDAVLGLTDLAGEVLSDNRTGRNSRHSLIGQFRQSVFGRIAGYEDVNDAERLGRDPNNGLDRRWPGRRERGGVKQPDGALRDRDSDRRGQSQGARGSVGPMD